MYRNLTLSLVFSALFLALLPGIGVGADYSSMSTEELSKLRGTMYNATQEDRDAFRTEWTERINQMTPEDKERYLGSAGGVGQGNRAGSGLGDGTGRGKGGGGNGQGASQGAGQGGNRQ